MPGVGHKIKSFFLRDIVCLLDKANVVQSVEQGLFLFPMDVWIVDFLIVLRALENPQEGLQRPLEENIEGIPIEVYQGIQEFDLAKATLAFCIDKKICPLRLNMGIWKYYSDCIQSRTYLQSLLNRRNVALVMEEFNIIGEYI
jgi:hypothetical protein